MQILESDPTDVIVYGHSHRSQSKAIDGILSFNPGKATDSFGILTIGGSNGEQSILDHDYLPSHHDGAVADYL
jgi:predicted phosphodiesterase